MQLHREEWHVRVYQWWYNHKYNHRPDGYKIYTNLCPYMRAVMFWAPLRAIFWNWITVLKLTPAGNLRITLNMLTIPFLMYALPQPLGYISYKLKMVAWILTLTCTAIAAVVGVCLAGIYAAQTYYLNWIQKNNPFEGLTEEQIYQIELAKEQLRLKKLRRFHKLKRFNALVTAYLRSGHDRICPEVVIVDTPLPPPSDSELSS